MYIPNETVEEFLARGGKIKEIKSGADKYISKIPQYKLNSRFHYLNPEIPEELVEEGKKYKNRKTKKGGR